MSDYRVSVVVPTKDREEDLRSCIASLGTQTVSPHEIIIVNDGHLSDQTTEYLRGNTPQDSDFIITESDGPPSSSTARNTGSQRATGDVVLILDDDVVLGESYIEHLIELYRQYDSPLLAGIGGFDDRIESNTSPIVKIFDAAFFHGDHTWNINAVGIHSQNSNITEPVKGDWICGHNASFKREVLNDEQFMHWSGGREALEDIEFGWRLKTKGYHCIIDPALDIQHNKSEVNRRPKDIGIKRGRNRVRIFREHGSPLWLPAFLWAGYGEVLRKLLAPLYGNDLRHCWLVAFGLTIGLTAELLTDSR